MESDRTTETGTKIVQPTFSFVSGEIDQNERIRTCRKCGANFFGDEIEENFRRRTDTGNLRTDCNDCRNKEKRKRRAKRSEKLNTLKIGNSTSDLQDKIIERTAEILADKLYALLQMQKM